MSAVTVLKVINGDLVLDEQQLKNILLHPKGKNKNVAVISITGALRKGKTTLLNFIRCHLDEGLTENTAVNRPLNGFLAKQGSDPVTEGIVMWSEPIIKTIYGEEVAVYLIDTEGAHEMGSNYSVGSAIFALTSLISSVQIFNVMSTIEQRDFELLVQFGRYATEISNATRHEKPFQKIVVLIRDWFSPWDIKYGPASLRHVLSKTSRKYFSNDWVSISGEVEKSYNNIYCHLLPHPGRKVAVCTNGYKSDFYLNDFEDEFIYGVRYFIEGLLTNNIVKKVGGQKIKSHELFELFKDYYNIFKNGSVPAPDSILKASAKQDYEKAYETALKLYKSKVINYMDDSGYFVTTDGVKHKMDEAIVAASDKFGESTHFSHPELQTEYFHKLSTSVKEFDQESLKGATKTQRMRKAVIAALAVGVGGVGIATGVGGAVIAGATIAEGAACALSAGLVGCTGTAAGACAVNEVTSMMKKFKHNNVKLESGKTLIINQ